VARLDDECSPKWNRFSHFRLKKNQNSTAIKYIRKTVEEIKRRPADSDEEPSILEQMFERGLSSQDAVVMVSYFFNRRFSTNMSSENLLLGGNCAKYVWKHRT